MLCKLISAELVKLRRSPVWLAFLVLPVIPALLGTLNYLGNLEILNRDSETARMKSREHLEWLYRGC